MVQNVEVTAIQDIIDKFENSSVNLNGTALSVINVPKGIALKNSSLTIENGTFNWNSPSAEVVIGLQSGSEATFKNVKLNTNATINVEPGSEPANVNIIDSEICSSDYYCISTNAANNLTGKIVEINIVNSTLTVEGGRDNNGDCSGILFNIPGTLNITNSTVTGDRYSVIVRCRESNIKNSVLNCSVKCPQNLVNVYDDAKWGSGNEVPVAVLVVENRSNADSYPYDASCNLENTVLNIPEDSGRMPIYAVVYNGHTTTIYNNADYASLTADSDDDSYIYIK